MDGLVVRAVSAARVIGPDHGVGGGDALIAVVLLDVDPGIAEHDKVRRALSAELDHPESGVIEADFNLVDQDLLIQRRDDADRSLALAHGQDRDMRLAWLRKVKSRIGAAGEQGDIGRRAAREPRHDENQPCPCGSDHRSVLSSSRGLRSVGRHARGWRDSECRVHALDVEAIEGYRTVGGEPECQCPC
jgi:hypothetical protein